ncbi:hypothetical protein FWK35_00014483 [Aphis craccivora]|uniref:Uncharacterized protein n=1 Tax=Aphis craccivora TaxID=307492 RepID=A0A6G0Y739_APHCR|nr:hypothetical protein FWK35_00014483 [Aphis craccivora]
MVSVHLRLLLENPIDLLIYQLLNTLLRNFQ